MHNRKIDIVKLYPWLSDYGVRIIYPEPELNMYHNKKLSIAFEKALKKDKDIDDEDIEELVKAFPNWLKKYKIPDNLSDSARETLKQTKISKDKFLNFIFSENQLKRSSTDQFRWLEAYPHIFCDNSEVKNEWREKMKIVATPFSGPAKYEFFSTEEKIEFMDNLAVLLRKILVTYIDNHQ